MKPGPTVRRLHDGSAIVARRIGRAFIPEGRALAAVVRCGAGLYVAPRLLDLAHQSPIWLVGGTCAWCVAAWRADRAEAWGEDAPAAPSAPASGALRQAVVEQLQEWIGDRPGMHLAEVYHRYRNKPGHEHLTDDQIRTALADHYDIPIRRAVRDPHSTDKPVRAGIHRDDLAPLPSPGEETDVAAPVATHVTSSVAS